MFFNSSVKSTYTKNLSKWINGETNVLLITGLAGSGKTTMAKKLATEHNAILIHTDDVANEFEDNLLKNLSEEGLNSISDSDVIVSMVENLVDNYKGKRIIIEGIHLLAVDKSLMVDKSIIVTGTGLFKSNLQASKRDKGLGFEHLLSLYRDNVFLNKKRNELVSFLMKTSLK